MNNTENQPQIAASQPNAQGVPQTTVGQAPACSANACPAPAPVAAPAQAPVVEDEPRKRGRPPLGGLNRKRINLSFDREAIRLFRAAANDSDVSVSLWLERIGRRHIAKMAQERAQEKY